MKQWWEKIQNDEVYFRGFCARVGRFCLAFGGALIATWAGAPDWVKILAGTSGYLIGAGEKNPIPPREGG